MPSKKQSKGYRSNEKARIWMFEHGFSWIYFHPHPAHADLIFVDKSTKLYARDLWNLFDGMALDSCGDVVFFQVKTNGWDGFKRIVEFTKGKSIKAIIINARDRLETLVRFINYPTKKDARFAAMVAAEPVHHDMMEEELDVT